VERLGGGGWEMWSAFRNHKKIHGKKKTNSKKKKKKKTEKKTRKGGGGGCCAIKQKQQTHEKKKGGGGGGEVECGWVHRGVMLKNVKKTLTRTKNPAGGMLRGADEAPNNTSEKKTKTKKQGCE